MMMICNVVQDFGGSEVGFLAKSLISEQSKWNKRQMQGFKKYDKCTKIDSHMLKI